MINMSHSKSVYFFLICIVTVASCSPPHEKPANKSGTNKKAETPPRNGLERVLYPKAVIRFKVGKGNSQEVAEGLHFETRKRAKGHLTGVDVSGDEFVLRWEYLGSDENSDNYQISLTLPGDQQPSQDRELQYSGERSVTFYKTDKVGVTIEASMGNSNEDQP
jgi:hypothetical protein